MTSLVLIKKKLYLQRNHADASVRKCKGEGGCASKRLAGVLFWLLAYWAIG